MPSYLRCSPEQTKTSTSRRTVHDSPRPLAGSLRARVPERSQPGPHLHRQRPTPTHTKLTPTMPVYCLAAVKQVIKQGCQDERVRPVMSACAVCALGPVRPGLDAACEGIFGYTMAAMATRTHTHTYTRLSTYLLLMSNAGTCPDD